MKVDLKVDYYKALGVQSHVPMSAIEKGFKEKCKYPDS